MKRPFHVLFRGLAALLLVFQGVVAWAAPPGPHQFTLSNGMTLIV